MHAIVGKVLLASALLLAVPLQAAAASANPATINFGNVPLNTTVSRTVTITVDAGFNLAIASGTGLNAPFSFDFSVCGTGGGFTGPGTCTVVERFTPTAIAASSGTTNVFECPVAGGTCIAIPFAVNGTGVSAAAANPPSVAFGNVPINTTVTQAVTLTVDAGYRTEIASGTGLNAPFSFDFSACGTGGGFAGPGTCTVNQRFTPTTAAASSGTTNVFECPVAGGTCIPIPYTVSGTGVITAAANPPSVAFGNVPINTTVTQSVTLTVDAGYRTEIASGSGLNTPFSFDFSSCGTAGGFTGPGTCTVNQRFSPTAAVSSSGTTNVFECPVAGGTCIPIPYSVSGTGGSVAAASPTSIAFGNVPINTTVTRSVTIAVDAGYRTEIASGSGINQPFSFDFSTCGAGGGFAGPGTCTVTQRYTPTAAVASSGTTNVFECPVVGGSCIPIPYSVSGTGVVTAAANPTSVNFGSVPINTTVSQSVTLTVDAGYRTEIASGAGINVPFGFDFSTCGAGGGFTGPGTCTVTQRFSPTAGVSSSGTTNVFECPVVGGSCIPIPYSVSGTGVVTAAASPTSVNFGNVPINTTVSQSVTITVDAGYRTEIASGSGINVPFSFDFSSCGTAGGFAGPGTCTVTQRYSPTAAVASSGTTNVFECPVVGGSCIPIPYSVSGTGVVTAVANPASVNFGNVPINSTVSQSVTITVDAGYRTEIASGSGINVPFSFDFSTCGAGGGFTGPGTCTVTQRYTPTAAVASSGTTNVFECPVVGGSCIPIPYSVSGTGVTNAAANPSSVNFGNVPINTTVTVPVTITVDAGYRTEIASGSGINVPFSFGFNTCGAGGGFTGPGTCIVNQSFTPTAAVASSGTTNVFECPIVGGSCIPISYSVSGTGVVTAAASPTSVAFGNVPINTTVTLPVTITVDAGYRTQIASGTGINVPFSFGFSTCGAGGGFAGPGTCTVNQSFTPTAAVASSGITNVFECPIAGGGCIPISYAVSGTGVSNASANPASVAFGNVPINTTVTLPVTITVDAGYRTQIASGTGINVPFSFGFGACGAGGGFTGPGTCTVNQSFTPTALVASSGTTNVFECPIAGGACIPIPYAVSGTGVSNASASPSTVNFGDVPLNTTATLPVTITVDAGYRTQIASGTGINVPFSFGFGACGAGGGFTGPGTCTVNQSFTPTALVASSGTTNVFECPVAGGGCIPIPYSVSGTGISTRAASPTAINFGNVPVGTTATQNITLTVDAGYRAQSASGGGINAPFSFDLSACGAGGGFAGPGTCVVKESFTPNAIGPASGTLTVVECPVAGGSCLGIDVTVSGAGVTAHAVSPTSINFGAIPLGTTAAQVVTVTVDGGYRIAIGPGGTPDSPFAVDFNTCAVGGGFTGPGTCTVRERFTPNAIGPVSGTLTISECPVSGGGSCLGSDVALTGAGVSNRGASPASVNFGNVNLNTTVSRPITLTIDAGYRVTLVSDGPNPPFSVDVASCGVGGGSGASIDSVTSLAGFGGPGTCVVSESFTPNAPGPVSGTLSVSECPISGSASCLPIDVPLSGTGVSTRSASPASVSFGNVNLNATVSQPIVLTIDAGYRVSLAAGGGPNPPFSVNLGACAAGSGFTGPGTCAVSEGFTPNAVGVLTGTLSVSECPVAGGGACLSIDVPLTGSGVSTRAANPASVNFGNVVVTRTVSRTITLTVDPGYRISRTGSGVGLPFSVDFNTCGTGAGFAGPGTCTVKESFTPTAAGPANATLTVLECPIAGGGSCLGIDVPSSGTGIATLIITTTTLPNGILDAPYPATTLQTIGGVPPITWSIVDGHLPRGLSLNPTTGTISGTPTAPHDHGHDRDRHDSCDGDGHDHWGHDRRSRDRDDCDARDGTGEFTFTVAATDKSDPSHQVATKTLSITVLGRTDLALSIAAPSPVQSKKLVTYTITVRNLGPEDGEAIVTDVLPATTQFVSVDTSQGHCSTPRVGFAGTVSCSLHSIDDGDRATIKITVDPTIKTGSISNTASVAVTGDAIDPVSTNNTATVIVQIK